MGQTVLPLPNAYVEILTHRTSECDCMQRQALGRGNSVKTKPLGWSLTQWDWWPHRKEFIRTQTHTVRTMCRHREEKIARERSQEIQAHRPQIPSLHHCEKINVCGLRPPVWQLCYDNSSKQGGSQAIFGYCYRLRRQRNSRPLLCQYSH